MEYLVVSVIAYLLGTVPFALLIVKAFTGTDLREKGSKNIGAMNSFESTGKKWIGIAVFFGDMFKGLISVVTALLISNDNFIIISLAAFFSVLGHNYNIFIKFKGGRGLSTALGAFILINPLTIVLWALMWLLGLFVIKRNVHVANLTATIGMPILIWSSPDQLLEMTSIMNSTDIFELQVMVSAVCFLILLRHIGPMINLIKNKEINNRNLNDD